MNDKRAEGDEGLWTSAYYATVDYYEALESL